MFEKIYLTILIIQAVLLIFISFDTQTSIFGRIVGYSWIIQFIFIVGYWIAKLLGLIWGFNLDLFPNIDFVKG